MRPAAAILALTLVTAPAFAQYDPGASRAENQVNSLNRSMQVQQENRSVQQQNQFETNALRNQMSRTVTPPPVGVPPVVPRR